MKKRTIVIISILLSICLCTGAVCVKVIKFNDSFADLSEEDKELKTKIAEISDTKVDFRHNKQEILDNKTYNLSFKEFNSENSAIREVIYTNDVGDEFKYSVKTGVLTEADINSNVVEKASDSIDIDTAHRITLEHFPKNCDIKEYTQIAYKEMEKGYFFWYRRYIGKYKTMDVFSMTVGYDGAIVTYHDTTDCIDWKKLDINEKYVDTQIQKYATSKGIADIKGDYIYINQGKVCVACIVGEYAIDIPLE